MMRSVLGVMVAMLLSGLALAGEYNMISPDEMKADMDAGRDTIIVDICENQMYAEGHLQGSVSTEAYPVKSEEDKAKLAKVLPRIRASEAPVVIVCPRGAGGAKRTYDYYAGEGVAPERLRILEGGLQGWPHEKTKE